MSQIVHEIADTKTNPEYECILIITEIDSGNNSYITNHDCDEGQSWGINKSISK